MPFLDQLAQKALNSTRATKSAGTAPAASQMVPSGGLFWDGRANTLQSQATGPMTNPAEMANKDMAEVTAKLLRTSYAKDFVPLFGARILQNPGLLIDEAMSAVSLFQIEIQILPPLRQQI